MPTIRLVCSDLLTPIEAIHKTSLSVKPWDVKDINNGRFYQLVVKTSWTLLDSFYQSSTAQQDHEDDERLKVVVLYDVEAGFSEIIPDLSSVVGCVYVQARAATVALWNNNANSPNIVVFVGLYSGI